MTAAHETVGFDSGIAAGLRAPGRLFQVERFETPEQMSEIVSDWDAVQDRCEFGHVLLDHRWVQAWWKNFGAGKDLHALVVRHDGRAVGVAPMIRSRGLEAWPSRDGLLQLAEDHKRLSIPSWRRVIPVRRVTFPLNVESLNSRSHVLYGEDHADVCQSILDYWKKRSKEWDVLVLEGLPTSSGQRELFEKAASANGFLTLAHGRLREMYEADITGGPDAHADRRGRHFRKRRKEQIRACEKAGQLTLQVYRQGDLPRGLELLFEIERATWKAKPGAEVSAKLALDAPVRAFYREVTLAFGAEDDAVIHIMSLDGRPVGGLLGLSRGTTMLSFVIYLRDDVRDVLNAAPLWNALVQDAADRNITKLDLNGVSPYARKWATDAYTYQRLYIFSPHARGRALWASKALMTNLSRRLARERAVPRSDDNGRD
jgi:CelD/BcsL family acetyltransferase involved in cellulose biosynthesis